MNSPIRLLFLALLIVVTSYFQPSESAAQSKKMIVGQAGVNPGAGLFSIAVREGLYQKHGLDVEIIKTNTTAAVQAMLANKMNTHLLAADRVKDALIAAAKLKPVRMNC